MKILYFGRSGCSRSKNLYEFLKKNSTSVSYYEFSNSKETKLYISKFKNDLFDYLICFRSKFIVQKCILKNCKISINFHPGTPMYRGTGCVNYAIYNDEAYFGSTAHLIDEKIDHGPIINVKKFRLKKSYKLDDVLKFTWDNMLNQAKDILEKAFYDVNYIQKSIENYNGDKWSKKIYTKKNLNNFYRIDLNSNIKNFRKKINATNTKNFKPYIIFHNKRFELKDNE